MNNQNYNSLELREIFHLEFLRWFGRKANSNSYALKGGTNLRFYFKSFRYSEDMDLDIQGIGISVLKEKVMAILQSLIFQDTLKSFGIEKIIPPDILKAKQTETTQRFKVHLITFSGEDLFTKVEFSRRGYKGGGVSIESVSNAVLRPYKLAPLLVPHYTLPSTIKQKIEALALRSVIQARDIFDLFLLSSQYVPADGKILQVSKANLSKAYENVFEISFEQFRDTVISYLSIEDQKTYEASSLWDEIKLKVSKFIEEFQEK
jgi:predicted nucleotidyltransferase component of viral defense system